LVKVETSARLISNKEFYELLSKWKSLSLLLHLPFVLEKWIVPLLEPTVFSVHAKEDISLFLFPISLVLVISIL
jgi:hypothetical protein